MFVLKGLPGLGLGASEVLEDSQAYSAYDALGTGVFGISASLASWRILGNLRFCPLMSVRWTTAPMGLRGLNFLLL